MDHSKKSTYLFSVDALRVLAILAVILIHITTKTLATLHLDIAIAPSSLFINQVSRFAVPLFFLISGFVLELNNKSGISYLTFFKKRASRIITPYIFWTSIYFIVSNHLHPETLLNYKFLKAIFLGNASYHLYFIPTLILFYLAFPFFHGVIKFLKNPFVLICICGVEAIFLYQDYYVKQLDFSYDIRIALLSVSMFITGMVASHYKEKIYEFVKKYSLFFAFATIALPLIIFLHVQAITIKNHTSRFIYNQYGPLNYLYTLTLSSLLYFLLERTQFLRNFFINLSKLSFFVFFIHVLIQTLLWDNVVQALVEKNGQGILSNMLFDPIMFCVIATISFGLAYFVRKIPYAEKITG